MPTVTPANPYIDEGAGSVSLAGGRFDMGKGSWGPPTGSGMASGFAGAGATPRLTGNGLNVGNARNSVSPFFRGHPRTQTTSAPRVSSSPDGRVYPQPNLNPANHRPSSVKPPIRDLKTDKRLPSSTLRLPKTGTTPSSSAGFKPTRNAATLPGPANPQGGLKRPANPPPNSPNNPTPVERPVQPLPRRPIPTDRNPPGQRQPQPQKPTQPPKSDRPSRPPQEPLQLPPSTQKPPPQQKPTVPQVPYKKPPFRGGQGYGLYHVFVTVKYQFKVTNLDTREVRLGQMMEFHPDFFLYGPIEGIISRTAGDRLLFFLLSRNPNTQETIETGVLDTVRPGTINQTSEGPLKTDYAILDVHIDRCELQGGLPDINGDPFPYIDAPWVYPGGVPAIPAHAPVAPPQPGLIPAGTPYPTPTPKTQPDPTQSPRPRVSPKPTPVPSPRQPPLPQTPQPSPQSPPLSPEAQQTPVVASPVVTPSSPVPPTGNPAPGREQPPCPPTCMPTVSICRYQPPRPICDEPCIVQMKQEITEIKNKLDGDIENKIDELLSEEEPDFLEKLQEIFDLIEQLFNDNQPSIEEQLLRQILDMLSQLLYTLEPGQEGDSGYIPVSVPIANYRPDGGVTVTRKTINVFVEDEAKVVALFEELATLKEALSMTRRNTTRVHNILGGTGWFTSESSTTPQLKLRPEADLQSSNPIPAKPTEKEKQQTVGSLLELVKLYAGVSYNRLGLQNLPAAVPETLLGYTDKKEPIAITSLAEYIGWFVRQFDAVAGKFPIEIEIEDSDPLTAGNQTKKVELPNISEALAELFGLATSGATNADLSINFLMRLAAEVIATKNATAITQDYARANAAFLGYKGNIVNRELKYAFNPSKLDSLEEFLKETKGYVAGWQEDDKESVVGYLQRISFAAGIIKAVFFRKGTQVEELQRAIASMVKSGDIKDEAEWRKFIESLNNPDSKFNQGQQPKPKADSDPNPPL